MSGKWPALASYFALVTASHSILDGLTIGSLGVALLAPFDNSRYFFLFRPIEVSPICLAFFGERGYTVIKSEIIWVWARQGKKHFTCYWGCLVPLLLMSGVLIIWFVWGMIFWWEVM